MDYLLLMTMAGSMLFVGYACWERLFRRFATEGMKYLALVCTLLVFAVPWVWLKGIYVFLLSWPLRVEAPIGEGVTVELADITTEQYAYITPDYRWQQLVYGIWTIVALMLVIRKCVVYFRSKRKLMSVLEKCRDSLLEETAERLKREFHLKRVPDIFVTPGRNATFTIGLFKPVILLQSNYKAEELYPILKHELYHVVRKDLLLKQLLEFVCCLHWFNPFVYLLRRRFNGVCESSCDERVNRGCTETEREAYSRLLIDNLPKPHQRDSQRNVPLNNGLDNSYISTMERVNLVMGTKERKAWKKRLAAGAFAAMMVLNSFTALAYPDVYHVDIAYEDMAEEASDGSAFWIEGTQEIRYNENVFEVLYEESFIDVEGNIYSVDSYSPYVFCIKHKIVPGYFQTHKKDENGGCTVKVCEGTRCTICNSIWVGDLYSVTTYVKCPH